MLKSFFCKIKSNFFTLHNDWRHMGASMLIDFMTPIQLDALMGTVSAIQDMIMQYNKQNLFILPARPDRFSSIDARGLKIPEGKVDVEFKDISTSVTVTTDLNCELTLHCNGLKKLCSFKEGQPQTIKF